MRLLIGIAGLLASSTVVAAQDASQLERASDAPYGYHRTVGPDVVDWPTAEKLDYLLTLWRLESVPSEPTDFVASAIYKFSSPDRHYPDFFTQTTYRDNMFFRPASQFPGDCSALIEREMTKMLSEDIRTALGIEFRQMEGVGGYFLPMSQWNFSDEAFVFHTPPNDRQALPLWEDEDISEPDNRGHSLRRFLRPFEEGDVIDVRPGSAILPDDYIAFLQRLQYRTPKGACTFTHNRGGSTYSVSVYIPIILGSPKAQAKASVAEAPKPIAPTSSAPKGGEHTLTRTPPTQVPPAAPAKVMYRPGERPRPPEAPRLPPCPGPTACVAGEGAPETAEGRAYKERLRAYEAALRDFEAKEAEAKAAVAALNKDNAAKYAAEQAAAKQRHDNAVAAREARIVSDQAAHNAKLRAHREETLRLARQHEAAMAEWRRKTAACLAGDRTQCAPQ